VTGTTSAPPATSGTPKKGVDCGTCDDWGTVVVKVATETGYRSREDLCPEQCAAAEKVRVRRGPAWS
jgi:hypothetical protein